MQNDNATIEDYILDEEYAADNVTGEFPKDLLDQAIDMSCTLILKIAAKRHQIHPRKISFTFVG